MIRQFLFKFLVARTEGVGPEQVLLHLVIRIVFKVNKV